MQSPDKHRGTLLSLGTGPLPAVAPAPAGQAGGTPASSIPQQREHGLSVQERALSEQQFTALPLASLLQAQPFAIQHKAVAQNQRPLVLELRPQTREGSAGLESRLQTPLGLCSIGGGLRQRDPYTPWSRQCSTSL